MTSPPPEALVELPLFPLPNAVLFPNALMPLHVFEPRYRAMIKHCLAGHRRLGIVMIKGEGGGDAPPLVEVAGVGVVVEAEELPDGRYNVLLRGEARVRLTELPFVPPFRRARAELLADEVVEPEPHDVLALLAVVSAFTTAVRAANPGFDFEVPPQTPGAVAADLVAQHLILDPAVRQTLLETRSPHDRVRTTLEVIAAQHRAMTHAERRPLN